MKGSPAVVMDSEVYGASPPETLIAVWSRNTHQVMLPCPSHSACDGGAVFSVENDGVVIGGD
jgi:hypothetical protein